MAAVNLLVDLFAVVAGVPGNQSTAVPGNRSAAAAGQPESTARCACGQGSLPGSLGLKDTTRGRSRTPTLQIPNRLQTAPRAVLLLPRQHGSLPQRRWKPVDRQARDNVCKNVA